MGKLGKLNKLISLHLASLKQELQQAGSKGFSMRLKLFLFLLVLVLTMFLGIVVILLISGTFTAGLAESEKLISNELGHTSQNISQQYGQLSMQAVEFSQSLSESMEKKLSKQGIQISNIDKHPEILEKLLFSEYERALFSLQRAKSSGIFIILNATVNPMLENSENSRSGLYIKNMEPNIISSFSPTITVLRGFPSIGRNNSLSLHAQWCMEFDISDAPYYIRPLQAAQLHGDKLPLSRLYYWSPPLTLPNTSEEVMLLSVPLIDSRGHVFGVCGFEISALLFKLSFMPNNHTYNRLFCLLAPISGNTMNARQSLSAGGYSARKISHASASMGVSASRKSFYTYRQENGSAFLGFHAPIQLYPQDSAFVNEKWAAAVLVPEEDIIIAVTRLNLLLASLLILLVFLGVIISLVLSRNYIKPITRGLDIIKSTELASAPKIKVPEIDELIDFLSIHQEKLYQKAEQEKLPIAVLEEFLENSKALSPAERAVFNLYVKGHTAKEIAEKLFLSINTIKTHNKRIYAKLNVASRKELLTYIKMLKEVGREFK